MVPKLSRVAVIWNPQGQVSKSYWKELQLAAEQLRVELHSLEVRNSNELDKVLETVTAARVGALVIIGDPVIGTNLKQIVDFATRRRLPSIYHLAEFADACGLITYGPDRTDMFRRTATFVDKIFKGAKPADLPVKQPTKFELVINMNTANALGLTIPPNIMVRATRVIE